MIYNYVTGYVHSIMAHFTDNRGPDVSFFLFFSPTFIPEHHLNFLTFKFFSLSKIYWLRKLNHGYLTCLF